MPKRQLIGIITSDKMQKTAVVEVERIKEHKKYKKRFKVHKKYKADNQGGYKTGDLVVIEECRPISKDKTWAIIKKVREVSGKAQQEIIADSILPNLDKSGNV